MSTDNTKFKLESNNIGMGISKVAQVVRASEIVDDDNQAGHLVLNEQIPAGAFVIGSKITVAEAFDGDSGVNVLVGVTGTVGKFSGVAHVLTAAARNLVQASKDSSDRGVVAIGTAVDARLTFGTDSDMTDVLAGNGKLLVEIFYLSTNVELQNGAPTEINLN
jgi:hypothetical protein